MIHQFFGLREQPFGVTPDPRYLYLGHGHREALASLFYGIEENRGFLTLIARPGMGKTTLLFHLLEKSRHSARTAFLFQTQCNSREFLRFLLAEFGLPSQQEDLVGMHERFNNYLLEQASAGHRVIIVIDEAQNLDPSVMETVRLLSNFETSRGKLLQIILAGQPELATKLASHSLRQLQQRIASFNRLEPLAPHEVTEFIDHRLNVARHKGPPIFDNNAKVMIANLSEGIPRNINSLCFGALSLACGLNRKTIDTEIIREVFNDLDLQNLIPDSPHLAAPRTASLRPLLDISQEKALSRPQERLPEVKPLTQCVALSSTEIVPDRVNHHAGANGRHAVSLNEPTRISSRRTPSLISRIAGVAVLLFMVSGWTRRSTAPVVDLSSRPVPANLNSLVPPTILKSPQNQVMPLAEKTDQAKVLYPTADRATLWSRVKEGNTSAEIQLAGLYLDGSGVERDCEQAHLLLLAASKKGSKVATGLLDGKYTEQCQ